MRLLLNELGYHVRKKGAKNRYEGHADDPQGRRSMCVRGVAF
jgi:hypothetical protein